MFMSLYGNDTRTVLMVDWS